MFIDTKRGVISLDAFIIRALKKSNIYECNVIILWRKIFQWNRTNVIDNQKILKNYDVAIILAHAFQISIIGRKVLIESLPLMVIIIYCVFAIDAVHKVSGFNNNFKV